MKMVNKWTVWLWVDDSQVMNLGVRDEISAMRTVDHLEEILEEDGFEPSGLPPEERELLKAKGAIWRRFVHPERGIYALVAAAPKESWS